MQKILLVASSNGLGHARRLLFLYNEFLNRGIPTGFVLNELQYVKCRPEIETLANGEIIISNFKYGLDGPHSSFNGGLDDKSFLRKISEADSVLSDNVLWPANYNKNVHLHGHFTWVDYWEQANVLDFDIAQLAIEKEFKEEIVGWFKPQAFGLSNTFLDSKVIPMPLIRYPHDVAFERYERNWSDVWISVGTTKDQNYPPLALESFRELEGLGFHIHFLETYQFHNLKVLPGLVVGRPGLGTIRDCLASGTPFLDLTELALGKVSDPELKSNLDAMGRLGLLINKEAVSVDLLTNFGSKYLEFWSTNSTDINLYADKILTTLSGNGS